FQPRHLDGWAADLARSQALACGPAAFVEAVGEQLGARFAGLQTESFSVPRWRSGEAPREVRLRFARSQREVSGDSAASLLEQAEAHGLRPAHGCRQGICASCTCVLLSGCVRDLRSGALCSEPGQPIRLCVSAAHGDLALDL
ncbi:iron-sulfur cluster-binding domain-containing protein, partial [Pseudomonas aeruginosa]|nr:iron-sulfur cluster-binding domain-containing protein [Pseudomonas aeruginosa]